MHLLAPENLVWLWAAIVGGAVALHGWNARRVALRRLADAPLLADLTRTVSRRAQMVKVALGAAALFAAAFALARPGWNPTPKEVRRMGRDVVFVVDVSRSMLAEDLAPNRLERAKIAIDDALRVIDGDRVGLIAFAGSASLKCPLTLDYGFFRMALESLSPNSAGRGGTAIGDAIRVALDQALSASDDGRHRDIVLITDGEDHETFPVEAAAKAGEAGVRIIAIGLGDEVRGSPIPVTDESGRRTLLTYQGEPVLSRLDGETLRDIASSSRDGVYLNVATDNLNLDEVYATLIRRAERSELESRMDMRYDEGFQVFLGLAAALLFMETLIGERRRA